MCAARSLCNLPTSLCNRPHEIPSVQTVGTATISIANNTPIGISVFGDMVMVPPF